jgi:hypothetical protein
MLWLLQNNYVEAMTGRLAWALNTSGRTLHDFSLVPGEPLPEFPCQPTEPHFFYGSTGLLQRLRESPQWAASVYGDKISLDQRHWYEHRAPDMLNATFELMTLQQLRETSKGKTFFVRPVVDQKAFAGQVVQGGDLAGLYRGRKGEVREHRDDLLVAVSPLIPTICAEYRLVVKGHRIRLGSQYRKDGHLDIQRDVPAEILAKAQVLADGWLPADFIVMDVAVMPDGDVRIIEFNSVHSSGLYAIPGAQFAALVEEAWNERAVAAGQSMPDNSGTPRV